MKTSFVIAFATALFAFACTADVAEEEEEDTAVDEAALREVRVKPSIGTLLAVDVTGCAAPGVCKYDFRADVIAIRDGAATATFESYQDIEHDVARPKGTITREPDGAFHLKAGANEQRLTPAADGQYQVTVLGVPAAAGALSTLAFDASTASVIAFENATDGPRVFSKLNLPQRDLGTVFRKELGGPNDPIRISEDLYKRAPRNVHPDIGLGLAIRNPRLVGLGERSYTLQSSVTGATARQFYRALPRTGTSPRLVRFALDDDGRKGTLACRLSPAPLCTAEIVVAR